MKKLLFSTLILLLTSSVYSQNYELYQYADDLGGFVIHLDEGKQSGTMVVLKDLDKAANFSEGAEIIWNNVNFLVEDTRYYRLPTSGELKKIQKIHNNVNTRAKLGLKNARYWGTDGNMFSYACQLDVKTGRVIDETVFGSNPSKAAAYVRLVNDF